MQRISHVFYLNSVSVTLSLLSKPLCRSCVASFMIKTGEDYEGFGKILHMFRHYRLEYQKLDLVLIIDASVWYYRMQMAFETTIFRNVQKLILIGFAKNADSAKSMWSDIYPALTYPGFKRIFFSYRYWWFAAKPRPWGAKRRGERTSRARVPLTVLLLIRNSLFEGTIL